MKKIVMLLGVLWVSSLAWGQDMVFIVSGDTLGSIEPCPG